MNCRRKSAATHAAMGVVPALLLLLIPKCPACIAAYLALGAGIGISVSTAGILQTTLIGLRISALAFPAIRILFILTRKNTP